MQPLPAAKKWYASKTLWANMLALVGGVGTYLTTGDSSGLVAAAMGVLNIVLRVVTKQPLE